MLPIRAKKSLGQNFLKDPHYLTKIADAANIGPGDQVLEIGPGLGHLTRQLCRNARRVLALELDERLIPHLQKDFAADSNVEIRHADALEFPYAVLPGAWKVVANLPYYISTPVIQRLLSARQKFVTLTLMLQKEVAERIAAPPRGREYGYLSVLVQFHTVPKVEFLVPPAAFTPKPEVESAVITLTMRERLPAPDEEYDYLMRVVKSAFSQRRKTLRNSLRQLDIASAKMEAALQESRIDPGRRAETLSVDEFVRLARSLR